MIRLLLLTIVALSTGLRAEEIIEVDRDDAPQHIKLLPHQLKPINYLLSHDDVKGLLVNHEMGTGKTYMAIGFAERLPQKEVYVVAPRFIEAHWRNQLKTFGVKNLARYHFVSYNNAPKVLLKQNLKDAIVILDECHNLIKFLKSTDIGQGKEYSELYTHLRSAYKIVALTGTPIYNDEYDLAYIFNLISAKDLVTFNEEEFRLQYTYIDPWRSFGRGFMSESMMLGISSSLVIPFVLVGLFASPAALLAQPLILPIFPLINYGILPLSRYRLRHMDVDKFKEITAKYVSFYQIPKLDMSDYPSQKRRTMDVDYNPYQMDYFLKFAEANLNNEELRRMTRENAASYDDNYVKINSTAMQNTLRNAIGSGREIGNFGFADEKGKLVEPKKFTEILKLIKKEKMQPTVVYSNYYENGIKLFASFLDANGLRGSYAILHPDDAVEKQAKTIENYNTGKVRILLLHPEITEGISLKGTRQFHILEPVMNSTILNQIVARAVRYKSHIHLPKNERHVDVYLWKGNIAGFSWSTHKLLKDNWRKRYSELSDWSLWGQGITQIDKNFDRKIHSPDAYAFMKLEGLNDNIAAFKEILQKYSIEKAAELEIKLNAKTN